MYFFNVLSDTGSFRQVPAKGLTEMYVATAPRIAPKGILQIGRFYRPELDVLRFFAFLFVFLHHYIFVGSVSSSPHGREFIRWGLNVLKASGAFGVCLFFLLSAFLITELLCREFESKGGIDVRAFYMRRIFRIWPLYFSFLIFCAVLGYMAPIYHAEAWRFASFIFLSGNWYCSFFGWPTNPMGPLWSVSIEEQFYLLWPTIAKYKSKRLLLFVAFAVIVVSNCSLLYLGLHHTERNFGVWTNSFVQFYFFGLGAILSLLLNGRIPINSAGLRLGTITGGLLCWGLASAVFQVQSPGRMATVPDLIAGYLCIAGGAVLIFLGILGLPSRFLPSSLIYLGKISYGLYVFHNFAILLAGWVRDSLPLSLRIGGMRAILSFGFTVAFASVSYRWLETPFLRMKRRFTIVDSRPV